MRRSAGHGRLCLHHGQGRRSTRSCMARAASGARPSASKVMMASCCPSARLERMARHRSAWRSGSAISFTRSSVGEGEVGRKIPPTAPLRPSSTCAMPKLGEHNEEILALLPGGMELARAKVVPG